MKALSVALVACLPAVMGDDAGREILLRPTSAEFGRRAPRLFRVSLETSQGVALLEVQRNWAPLGVDRFYNLVRYGYYDNACFFRVIAGRWAQFGIHADPRVSALWRNQTIPDDPPRCSNVRGTIAYAFALPGGRTTQVFINLKDNASVLDPQGFAPFGRVIEGMESIDALNPEYGEHSGGGIRGGKQDRLFSGGNEYLFREFPRLDYVRRARLMP